MSIFFNKVQGMMNQIERNDTRLISYQVNYNSFGHETMVYINWERKFFIEFFHDARDDVDYSVSVAGYYTKTYNDLEDYKCLKFVSMTDLARQQGWIQEGNYLTFDEEFEILKSKYNLNFYKILREE